MSSGSPAKRLAPPPATLTPALQAKLVQIGNLTKKDGILPQRILDSVVENALREANRRERARTRRGPNSGMGMGGCQLEGEAPYVRTIHDLEGGEALGDVIF